MMRFFRKNKDIDIPRRRQGTDVSGGFQRNRTITGSSSDSIYAASTSNAHLESPRTRAHSLRQTRRRVGILIVAAIAGVLLFGVLLTQYIGTVQITSTDAGLSSDLEKEAYARSVDDYLGSRFFERFRFSVSRDGLKQFMQTKYPEIASIRSVDGDSIGSASIVLSLRKPVASWLIGDKTYYVDAQGEAFEKNYFNGTYVKIIDESGISISDGSVLASGRFLGFVGRIVSSAQEYGYTVTEAHIPTNTTREVELRIGGVAPVVRMSIDRPAGEQAEDMASAVRHLQALGRTPSYIDVRVSGKAFYQ